MDVRTEYPRPQFRREAWQCLNGEWEFAFDDAGDGCRRGLPSSKKALPLRINVPFSYRYPASGIGCGEEHKTLWYRRLFRVEPQNRGRRALLCFNGAFYRTEVWVNGTPVLSHCGGYAPFSADITPHLRKGENVLVVRCEEAKEESLPRGKQSWTGKPFNCWYSAHPGIWQSVWLEFFGSDCIDGYSLLCDYDRTEVYGSLSSLYGRADRAEILVSFQGRELQRASFSLQDGAAEFRLALPKNFTDDYSWTPECPQLLQVGFRLFCGGEQADLAHARIGMRKISVDAHGKICLNNRPYFQRLVLDQGYWRDSGPTAPSAQALKEDILAAKAMGFNGARKHQKAEDSYFAYYAEELGFLTWCEMPSAYKFGIGEMRAVCAEWLDILKTARNCTSNVCYVPLNESWGAREIVTDKAQQDFARALYYLTKAADPTRLVSANDGFGIVETTDIVGIHDYEASQAEEFVRRYGAAEYDSLYTQGLALFAQGHRYLGQPVLLTECGGIALKRDEKGDAWGYKEGARDEAEVLERLTKLIGGIESAGFQGFCYTQLTDVQQEVNGLLNDEHKFKFDAEKLRKIFAGEEK